MLEFTSVQSKIKMLSLNISGNILISHAVVYHQFHSTRDIKNKIKLAPAQNVTKILASP